MDYLIYHKMVRIPIEVDIPISITSDVMDGIMIVTVSSLSNVDLSKLTWSIVDIKPQKTTSLKGGTLLVMSFWLFEVGKYNLATGTIQSEFLGSDVFEYLQTSDSGFGKIIKPPQTSIAPAAGAILAVLLTVGAAFIANRKSANNSDDETEEDD